MFGKIAVDLGLCTDAELRRSLEELDSRKKVNPIMLQDLMVNLGYITPTQAERLRKQIKDSKAVAYQIPGYKIIGKLGAGAMAIVYKGKQISLNRTVAIKVLPKRFSENPEYVERFYKEGQAAGKLNHNNIVQAIDVGEAGGYHYFVMECVEGKTIYDDIAEGKIPSEKNALDIIIQVAKALEHAHNCGLIHRDVKPKNIMINKEGVVKLADMGLARETADIEAAQTEAGRAYGTPYYISPEQIKGEVDIDGRADIYGLGATFYHMVTGRVPYMADDPATVMRKHLRDKLIPPDHINKSLSAGVSEVIEVMMAKRKEERYNNATELQRFDVSILGQLEDEGEEIEAEQAVEKEEILMKYKMAVVILSAVTILSILIMILLLFKNR
jgi:serine/threonine-protein kinase